MRIWRVLVEDFFSQWVQPSHSVLDLGAGYCEFINNVTAARRFAMDLNPSARSLVSPGTEFIEQDCSLRWQIPDKSLDIVFTSNFFEHLPTKQALQSTLSEAYRCLKSDGLLIAVGPNIKFLTGEYWDFFDHHLPLTERSLSEVLLMAGYHINLAVPKFLPYTMSHGRQPPIWSVRVYLKLRPLWRLLGRQFLIVAQK
ncbi:MAG: class I SAM-dependent methyltransferase [Acidobacteriaceae bacterium]|nr:class I SAM-dependent methyltransferase [Acidobacteriaceae bacterium]